jgi:hypothetical protein
MALMEANPGASEDEYLFGAGTEFTVDASPGILAPHDAAALIGHMAASRVFRKRNTRPPV